MFSPSAALFVSVGCYKKIKSLSAAHKTDEDVAVLVADVGDAVVEIDEPRVGRDGRVISRCPISG